MKLSKFAQRDKASPIHSSGFVQSGDRIGSTAVDPFLQRVQRDKSRQMIGGYRDAQVLRQARYENRDKSPVSRRDAPPASEGIDNTLQLRDQRRGSRIDIVRPTASSSGLQAPPAPKHSFREPQSRHRP